MSSKGSLAKHHAERPRWVVIFHPEIAVLSIVEDQNRDLRVTFRHNGRRASSIVNTERGVRYFLVARQRIYFSDLRKAVAT